MVVLLKVILLISLNSGNSIFITFRITTNGEQAATLLVVEDPDSGFEQT